MTNYKKLRKKSTAVSARQLLRCNGRQFLSTSFRNIRQKFLTRRLLRTVLRKLSEFLCSTNVGPGFFPIDRPATGAGSMYGRYLGKSVQFDFHSFANTQL